MSNIRNNNIVKNIRISEEMKNNLYEACVSDRRSSVFSFVYSKQIAAVIAALAVILTGVSVSAAVISWRDRIQSIPEEKKEEYIELANLSHDGEMYSRTYTKTELSRMQALLEEYHNGRYPESEITVVDTLAELLTGTVCYVKETGIIYFPDEEMTDEQLLQIIDYEEKSQYSLVGDIMDKPEDFQEGIAVDDTERARQIASDVILQYFGYDVTNDVQCSIYIFEGNEEEGKSDSYCVSFSSDELSSWVSSVLIYCDTWEVYMGSHSGWGKYYESVGKAEVYARADEYSAAAQEYVSKHFTDTGALKSVRFKSDISGEEDTTERVALFLEYEQAFIRIDVSTYDDSIDTFMTWSDKEEFEDTIDALMNEFGYDITTLQ